MIQCKKCKLFLSLTKDDIYKCKGGCEAVFHKKCVQNNKQFIRTSYCDDCQKIKSSPMQPAQDPAITLSGEISVEKVLAEVNKKLEVLYNMEKKIEDLTTSVEFYGDMYQSLLTFKEETQKKITALEQRNLYLEKCNKALEERVQEIEVKEKEKNIEIHGLEMHKNEDTKSMIQNIAKKLKLDPGEIIDAQRVGKEKPDEKKPRIILINLRIKSARNKWLSVKRETKVTNNNVYGNGSDRQIFINEDLPKYVNEQ